MQPPIPPPLPIDRNLQVATRKPLPQRRKKGPQPTSPFVPVMIVLGGVLGILMGLAYMRAIGLDPFASSSIEPGPPPPHPIPARVQAPPRKIAQPPAVHPEKSPAIVAPRIVSPRSPSPSLDLVPQTDDPINPSRSQSLEPPPPTIVRYTANGIRRDILKDDNLTLGQWLDSAQNDLSRASRNRAGNTLLEITRRHANKSQRLDSIEQEMIRIACLSVLRKRSKDNDHVTILKILSPVADHSCRADILGMATTRLKYKREESQRVAAIAALTNVADESCVEKLGDVVREDTSAANRVAAAALLGKLGPAARQELEALLRQPKLDKKLSETIKESLDKVKQS